MQTTASLGVLARACLVFSRFWTAAAQPDPTREPDPDPVQHFDALAAWREGWTLSLGASAHADGTACVELQRLDIRLEGSRPVFASDGDAWQHVVACARQGSLLHRAALALVDRHERRLIEAACGAWPPHPD